MKTGVVVGIGATVIAFGLIAGNGSVFAPRLEAQSASPVPMAVEPPAQAPSPVSSCAPRFFVVTKIDERQLGVEECTLVQERMPNHIKVVHVETSWDSVQAFDAAGNKRSPEWVRKHVHAGDMVLIAAGSQPVAPAYLRLLREDAVILVGIGQLATQP